MEQLELEADATLADALSHACTLIGRKRVAKALWPEFSVEPAQRRLDHCFDPDRREKLSLEQVELILRMARDADVHVPMNYLTDSLSYERTRPVSPESETERLQRAFIDAVRDSKRIAAQLEKMQRQEDSHVRGLHPMRSRD